jgi:hypothetical protein
LWFPILHGRNRTYLLDRCSAEGAVEAGVGGAEDLAHTALADLLFNLVRSELLADGNERLRFEQALQAFPCGTFDERAVLLAGALLG